MIRFFDAGYRILVMFLMFLDKFCHYSQSLLPPPSLSLHWQVYQQVLNDQGQSLYDSLISSVQNNRETLDKCHSKDGLQKLLYSINGVCVMLLAKTFREVFLHV